MKRIASIIVSMLMVSIMFVGCGTKTTPVVKAAAVPVKASQTTPKISQEGIDISLIPVPQRGLSDYKEETQDINGSKVKVMTGTFSYDAKTGYYWLGGKQIGTPGYLHCISTSDKSISKLARKEKVANVTIMRLGTSSGINTTKLYEIIDYTGPYSAPLIIPREPSNKYIQYYGKVVTANKTSLTLDDGKVYDTTNVPFIQMMNADRGATASDSKNNGFLKSYNLNDFPKGTVVIITYQNGNIYNIARYCVLK